MEIDIYLGDSGDSLEGALLQVIITGVGVALGNLLVWAIPKGYESAKDFLTSNSK